MKALPMGWIVVLGAILLIVPAPSAVAGNNDDNNKGKTTFSVNNSGDNMVAVEAELLVLGPEASDPPPGGSVAVLGPAAPPPSADLGCRGQLSAQWWSGADTCLYNFDDDEPQEVPAIDLLYRALARTQVTSAGLKVEPWSRTYVGVPTFVHAESPKRQEVVSVLGLDVVVDFEASSFKYDFGDGLPALVTTDPSEGFPVSRLRHIYLEPRPQVSVVLSTTWRASMTHPVTGERVSVPGALVTTEVSAPLEVRKAKGYLTDTAEELMGR